MTAFDTHTASALNPPDRAWRPTDPDLVRPNIKSGLYAPEVLESIEKTIDRMSDDLRKLSLDIHGERRALDACLVRN